MKIFDRDKKINFVDDNNVFLGYDMNLDCTEKAGWYIGDREDNSLNGIIRNPAYEIKSEEYEDRIEDYNDELEYYIFDTNYFKEYKFTKDSGNISSKAIFRIINTITNNQKFIHLYNLQNGWYCHGFEFCKKILLNQGEL